MRTFLFGFLAGVTVLVLAGFIYVRFGFVNPRADIPVNAVEKSIAMPSLDASVDRRAQEAPNPVAPTDANLTSGMKIYQSNCAACHGDVNRPHALLSDSLYPRAPQFVEEAPDMPGYQNFYIIEHGVRLSGMPAWNRSLSKEQIWQVTTFLSHMDKLPAEVSDQWKKLAGESTPSISPRGDLARKHRR